ncbi:MAG: hypothetical protein LWW96_21665 [Acidovorax sp.]|uniref:hypothetical protein n=1 Tax=Acidovorax sp. TaxID=1872122 RepID=UPI0025BB8189|nr:hypothetical protein [Acidovorax sp.]MCE1194761.1 hypothetical protein [Acidovorax sp.]
MARTAPNNASARRHDRRRWAAHAALGWLVLALVLVPAIGRLHQIAHATALDRVHAGHALAGVEQPARDAQDAQAPGRAPAEAPQALLQLLGSHTPADCLVLDQLALGDAAHATPLALPPIAAPAQTPPGPAGQAGATHEALFYARGPPRA